MFSHIRIMAAWGLQFFLMFCIISLCSGENATNSSWQTWGPYRPNLYFGVRPLVPESLLMGLMWADGTNPKSMLKTIRHTCEENDGMDGCGWTMYDARVGGSQTIHDKELHIDLTMDFIKAENGESWAVRVTGKPRSDAPSNLKTAIIFYAAIEEAAKGAPKSLECRNKDTGLEDITETEATCRGDIPGLGPFHLQVVGDDHNNVQQATSVSSVQVPEDKTWQAKLVLEDQLKASPTNSQDDEGGAGNMHLFKTTFEGPFTATFTYRTQISDSSKVPDFHTSLNAFHSAFQINFDRVFPRVASFQDDRYVGFSQALLSNLLGGLGFFHGNSKVDYSHAPEYDETEPDFWDKAATAMARATIETTNSTSLFSFTPSRPFFPRGFLWDEGFHLLPVIEWDLDLAVSVLESWLSLMDEEGWIAREQILGPEARSKVPKEFQIQYPHYANPPTLSMLFPILISKLVKPHTYTGHPSIYVSSEEAASTLLKKLYPLLSRHYQWFRRTQAGDFQDKYPRPHHAVRGEGYRWRGRTPQHTLTSGLDDYPRADPPHPSELHIDALAWVGASAKSLQQVAEYLGEAADASMYARHLKDVKNNLDALHWSPIDQAYCDATTEPSTNGESLVYKQVCHLGYISLFPLLLGLMDAKHPHLPLVLDLLSDPTRLWSPYGLRSLSAVDPNYGTGENYWRGAVWMNLNVLAVLRLRDLGTEGQDGGGLPTPIQIRARFLAADLRERLVKTVYKSWETTGFIWEQYSDETGKGSHSRAFTGWTACVILLLGLDLPTQTGGGDQRFTQNSSFWFSTSSLVLFVLFVAVIVMFKRRLMSLTMHAVKYWHRWRTKRTRRGRYEQIINLEEREGGVY
ncbi:glycoside hydrolase family 63 protein [Xylariales sp. PMI_506]|nr:glycoside hydrolase family 63 protein [Xylariales sp. PMI_506]